MQLNASAAFTDLAAANARVGALESRLAQLEHILRDYFAPSAPELRTINPNVQVRTADAAWASPTRQQQHEWSATTINRRQRRQGGTRKDLLRNTTAKVRRHSGVLAGATSPLQGDSSGWQPLEGSTISEILAQDADPLRSVVSGKVPAIILRGAMSASSAAAVSHKLLHNRPDGVSADAAGSGGRGTAAGTGLFVTSAVKKNRPAAQFGAYGVMLSRILGTNSPTAVAKLAAKYQRLYEEHGIMEPLRTLRTGLEALGAGRRVGAGIDRKTNMSLSPGGAFRMHYNNGSFGVHFDSLHSRSFVNRSHCRGTGMKSYYWGTTYRGRVAERFEDLFRFDHQLAALVTLQRSERDDAEMSVANIHKDRILQTCIPYHVTQHNVILDPLDPQTSPAMRKKNGWSNAQIRRWRDEVELEHRTQPLNLHAGDLYIFNANNLHIVHPTIGDAKRLSFGAFVGFADDEIRIWS